MRGCCHHYSAEQCTILDFTLLFPKSVDFILTKLRLKSKRLSYTVHTQRDKKREIVIESVFIWVYIRRIVQLFSRKLESRSVIFIHSNAHFMLTIIQ